MKRLARIYRKTVMTLLIAVLCIAGIAAPLGGPALAASEPLATGFAGFKAIVVGDVCNVRSQYNTSSQVLGTVSEGASLDVLGFQNNWAKVRFSGREGWIAGWLVDIDLKAQGVKAQVVAADVNLREGPGTDFGVKGMTQKGVVYEAEAKRGAWIRVTLPSGGKAWISEPLVMLIAEMSDAANPSSSTSPQSPPTGSDSPGSSDPSIPPASSTPVTSESKVVTYYGDLVVYPVKDRLDVTSSPVKGSSVLGRLNRGEAAKLIDSAKGWLLVELTSGVRGWAYGPEATVVNSNDSSISLSVSESTWTIGKYPTVTVTASDVNYRSGPSTSYPVVSMVQKGNVLRVLETSGDWIKAVSPKGVTGWVAGWLTSGITAAASSAFAVTAEAGVSSRTLTVSGPFANAIVIPSSDKKSVVVSTSSFFSASATLPVGSFEFGAIKVATSDVTVAFQDAATYVVKSNAPGKVVLEFRPNVTSVDVKSNSAGEILTINTLGYAMPDVIRNGNLVTLSLPGASYSGTSTPSTGQIIKAVAVQSSSVSTDVVLTTSGSSPYLLKKVGNNIEAHFAAPGLVGKRIVVDPGHETDDPGAIGPTGLSERNVNWEVAERLVALLKEAGADAVLTRSGPYVPTEGPLGWTPDPNSYGGSLAKRAAWSIGADLFISIHNDWNSNSSVSGTTVYACDSMMNSRESRRFAAIVADELTAAIGTYNRGVKGAEFYVLRESTVPAVLVEMMFISNPREESYLRQSSTWDLAARGMLSAVAKYFSQ